jgi:hypothetical protein
VIRKRGERARLAWATRSARDWVRPRYGGEENPPVSERRVLSKLVRLVVLFSGPALVFVQQALAQIEDGRGPETDEDSRLAPARHV